MSTRQELRDKFRQENPEITERVITDATLNSWMKTANREAACITRCIISDESKTFNTTVNVQKYDLETLVQKFYDIDDMPGGGVYYDGKPMTKSSAGEMNRRSKSWKAYSAGVPRYYWRRGKYLWFERKSSAVVQISIDCILLPDDFDDDADMPFNGLTSLQPYDEAISKYLQKRAKQKVGKYDEARAASDDYTEYLAWMAKAVKSAKYGPVSLVPRP